MEAAFQRKEFCFDEDGFVKRMQLKESACGSSLSNGNIEFESLQAELNKVKKERDDLKS